MLEKFDVGQRVAVKRNIAQGDEVFSLAGDKGTIREVKEFYWEWDYWVRLDFSGQEIGLNANEIESIES